MKEKIINKIAVRIPNWIGDAVLSTPFLRFTRKYFPDTEIVLIMRDSVKDVFLNNNNFDRLIVIDDKKYGFFKTGFDLRKYKFDLYFNLPESASSILIASLSFARLTIGYKGETGGLFLNKSLKNPGRSVNRAVKYFRLLGFFLSSRKPFRSRGVRLARPIRSDNASFSSGSRDPIPVLKDLEKEFIGSGRTELFLSEKEIIRAKQILKQYKLRGKIIGMNPNCSAESRRWEGERFGQLADILIGKYKRSVIFFGNKKEQAYISSIVKNMKEEPVNLAGKINLREYMGILNLSDLFITNDSGPMHLANALGTDVIALEGPADIRETGMFNSTGKRVYIDKKIPCSPCVKNRCTKNKACMDAITVADALKTVKKLL